MASFPDRQVIADLTAKMFLEVEAVRFMTDKPFIFTSGWASPVYIDCRRLISLPRVRRALMDFGASIIMREAGFEQFDAVAGGETAGIPFAAWMADKFDLPMLYVRKKAKGFGRNAQIEGDIKEGQRILLVEDLTTDGRSKVNFCNALREAGFEQFDAVAGGETAGIPFAAWMADKLDLPMLYVRKKAKGFGRNAQIEGDIQEGQRILLVEDLTTDGRSKVNFCNALRQAGAKVDHIFVCFFYDIYPDGRKILADLGINMHWLATWWDILRVAKASNKFEPKTLAEVEKFMHDPAGWSQAHGGVAAAAE